MRLRLVTLTPDGPRTLLTPNVPYPPIEIKELSSGYLHALGFGPCEWAQWPKWNPLTEAAFFPEASEVSAQRYVARSRTPMPDLELCGECGSSVRPISWRAPDVVWLEINGKSEGLLCIPCFDARAAQRGMVLQWVPVRYDRRDPATWALYLQEQADITEAEALADIDAGMAS